MKTILSNSSLKLCAIFLFSLFLLILYLINRNLGNLTSNSEIGRYQFIEKNGDSYIMDTKTGKFYETDPNHRGYIHIKDGNVEFKEQYLER